MSVRRMVSEELLLNQAYVDDIVQHTRSHYRRIQLESGRIVWQPSVELSLLQYWVIDWLASIDQSKPRFAAAYEPESSIAANAQKHVGANHVLAMDIRRFFPAIGAQHITDYLKRAIVQTQELGADDYRFILDVVMFNSGLVMGAPSSPFLANRVMAPVDEMIFDEVAKPNCLTYTRYSDDLFFSSVDVIDRSVAWEVEEILRSQGFAVNPEKTRFMGLGTGAFITGISIADGRVSLGQTRKRELKSRLYHFAVDSSPVVEEARSLLGFISFCRSIEPVYVARMLLKYSAYGGDIMMRISQLLREEHRSA